MRDRFNRIYNYATCEPLTEFTARELLLSLSNYSLNYSSAWIPPRICTKYGDIKWTIENSLQNINILIYLKKFSGLTLIFDL